MQEIADYGVPDLNTSGMVRTSVCDLLPVPSTDVKVWTRGLEPTNGGTVCPSEVLPPKSTTGRVAGGIPRRLSPSAPDAWSTCLRDTQYPANERDSRE